LKRFLLKFIVTLLSGPILRVYFSTIRIREHQIENVRQLHRENQTVIFSVWHENMMASLYANRNRKVHALVSQHFDGEIISRILNSIGFGTVRGSSTRGGFEAFLELKEKLKQHDVAITPDGPRGPRRKLKLGAVKLASETGNVVIPVGVACSRYKRLKSWDRFLLVLPFSKCEIVYGSPYKVPKKTETLKLRSHAQKLEQMLNQLDETAQKCLDR